MGIIRAAIDSIGGGLADSWLEVIEPSEMDMRTVLHLVYQFHKAEMISVTAIQGYFKYSFQRFYHSCLRTSDDDSRRRRCYR